MKYKGHVLCERPITANVRKILQIRHSILITSSLIRYVRSILRYQHVISMCCIVDGRDMYNAYDEIIKVCLYDSTTEIVIGDI